MFLKPKALKESREEKWNFQRIAEASAQTKKHLPKGYVYVVV